MAGVSFIPSGGPASASTSKHAAFCAAETFIAANALNGTVLPHVQWTTEAQEKKTFLRLDSDLALLVKDAPTKAFASVTAPLEGTFTVVLDSPRLLKEYFNFDHASTSASRSSSSEITPTAALEARINTLINVTESGDYVWPIYAACPDFRATSSNDDPLGNPPKFEATPNEVRAAIEGVGVMIGSLLMSTKTYNLPTVTSMKVSVKRYNARFPNDDITLLPTPTLSKGTWRAEYRVTANAQRFDVYVSVTDSLKSIESGAVFPRALNVVALTS
jgi:hypothetical protein